MSAFTKSFRTAFIFLGVLLGIALLLVLLYLILKRNMCNCFGKKKGDGEDDADDAYKKDEDEAAESSDFESDLENERKAIHNGSDNEKEDPEHQDPMDVAIPVVTVTDTVEEGTSEKKSKKSALKSVLKRIARPINKVRFGGVTESEQSPLVAEAATTTPYDGVYTLGVMQRSDSMESFVSSVSAVSTANVEEFGEEVSPGRLQISVEYVQRSWTLNIAVKQADCLVSTSKEKLYWQVHIALLPFKRHRFKTKYKSSSTPVFNQTYEVEDIAAQALSQLSVRFRVYGKAGTTGRKKLAGEVELHLSNLNGGEAKITEWLHLKRKGNLQKKESLV